jgi:uncharacterized membrane protein YdjX (TVP38/TMEM64 family)
VDPLSSRRRAGLRLAVFAALVGGAALLAWAAGLGEWVRPEGLARIRQAVAGTGRWAPVLYVGGYVLAELAFVPAIPLTLLSGALFGPIWGSVYASLGATLAAAAAFLVARYLARDLAARWIARSPRAAQLDGALARHGWRILVITRVLPIFPFNLQNFAYGLTRIGLGTYVLVSWASMLPGTVALTVAGAALADGGSVRRTLWLLAGAGVLVVAISLVPRWLAGRSVAARDLLPSRDADAASRR